MATPYPMEVSSGLSAGNSVRDAWQSNFLGYIRYSGASEAVYLEFSSHTKHYSHLFLSNSCISSASFAYTG